MTYTIAPGNARSLTHWARPGIEPSTSWIPVGLIIAEPLPSLPFLYYLPSWSAKPLLAFLINGDNQEFNRAGIWGTASSLSRTPAGWRFQGASGRSKNLFGLGWWEGHWTEFWSVISLSRAEVFNVLFANTVMTPTVPRLLAMSLKLSGLHRCAQQQHIQQLKKIFFCLFRAVPEANGSSQVWSQIEAVAASWHHSHSNVGSKLHLRPIPQLTAKPDPSPTERGQGSNPHAHGYQLDS